MNEVDVVYEEVGIKTEMSENQCYGNSPTEAVEHVKEAKIDSLAANLKNTSKQMKCMLFMIAVLAAILLGACAALVVSFVKISNLSKDNAEANIAAKSSIDANLTEIVEAFLRLEKNISATFTKKDKFLHHHIILLQNSIQNIMILNQTLQQLPVYSSCADILQRLPSPPSGYYWIRSRDGSDIRMLYCDMTWSCGGITGGWMRVAELDITDSTAQCPDNLALNTASPRTCRINATAAGCSSTVYSANSVEYSKVCGRIRAYQFGTPDAFAANQEDNIDRIYVDGVSLTHGRSPRHHIWTFAASANEHLASPNNCHCINGGTSSPPAFVGEDYFCDTAVSRGFNYTLYTDDPLWDGAGCGSSNTCCSFNNPPWFYKQLPQPTTNDIEMRVCRDQESNTDDIAIEIIQIFVQ